MNMIKNRLFIMAVFLVAVVVMVGGCAAEEVARVKNGDVVSVHYTGKLDDGTEFDSSIGGEPLQFTVGAGQMIPGFEQAVIGMKLGESRTVTIPVAEAYGPYQAELVFVIDRAEFPADLEPQVGQRLPVSLTDGGQAVVSVTEVSESTVTLDANHPLAGKDLTFEIRLVEIS